MNHAKIILEEKDFKIKYMKKIQNMKIVLVDVHIIEQRKMSKAEVSIV